MSDHAIGSTPGPTIEGSTGPLALLLAATAEAGPIALVVLLLLEGAGAVGSSVGTAVVVFGAVFTAACLVVWRLRAWDSAAPACVVGALVVGLILGRGTMQSSVIAVMVCVLVAFRVVTLALRDWREPDPLSLWVGGVVVGMQALAAGSIQRSWGPTLVVVVPVFFAASLASRAVVVWADQSDAGDAARSWVRRSGRLAVGLGVAALLAVLAGGTIDRLAGWLAPAGRAIVAAVAWGVSQLLRPVFWAFERANLDTQGAADLIERIRQSTQEASRAAADRADPNGGGGGLARVVALLFLVAFTALAITLFRRMRARPSRMISPLDRPGEATTSRLTDVGEIPEPDGERGERLRSENAVRRAYAEALDALDRRGLPKAPEATPAEFAREVARVHPPVGEDFDALTRAYEDVRYGAATFPEGAVAAVERLRRSVLEAVRHLQPPAEA